MTRFISITLLALATSLAASASACVTAPDESPTDGTPSPDGSGPADKPADGTGTGTGTSTPGTGPSDADPNKDADPNAPSPPDDTKTPPATRDELIKAYAPRFHLHPDDVNRPANVDWYLARATLRYKHTACPDHEILGLGKVTQESLVAQKHEDNKSFCRHDEGDVRTAAKDENFFLRIENEATRKGAPRSEWKTYAVWRDAGSGLVDIEYWAFYPYNDGFTIFNHESDWEHLRVRINPSATEKLVSVFFSQHHEGQTLKAGDGKLGLDGTHPVAYVAKGTHANYPQPGSFGLPGAGLIKDTAVSVLSGDVWKTETSIVLVGTRGTPQNGQSFVKFWGRWGAIGTLPETHGVTRHFP